MSTLYALGPRMGGLTHLADLASGARTWSVCVLAIAVAGGLRWTEHLSSSAFEGVVQAALLAVSGRAVGRAFAAKPAPKPAPAADERPTNPR